MQRHICLLQLDRFTGGHVNLSSEEKLTLAEEFIDRYINGLPFGKCQCLNKYLEASAIGTVHTEYNMHMYTFPIEIKCSESIMIKM